MIRSDLGNITKMTKMIAFWSHFGRCFVFGMCLVLFWCDSVSKHRSASIWEGSEHICCEFEVNARRTKNDHFGAAGGADGAGGVGCVGVGCASEFCFKLVLRIRFGRL